MNANTALATRAIKFVAVVTMLSLALGCNEKKPTYMEAVQLYEAEVAELNRLEARREEMLGGATKEAESLSALKAGRELIGVNAADLQKVLGEVTPGLIDPAAQAKSDESVKKSLGEIDRQIKAQAEKVEKSAAKAKENQEKLPDLDRQIEKQAARVEAARQAKEALAP